MEGMSLAVSGLTATVCGPAGLRGKMGVRGVSWGASQTIILA